jgi:hypothetical protein
MPIFDIYRAASCSLRVLQRRIVREQPGYQARVYSRAPTPAMAWVGVAVETLGAAELLRFSAPGYPMSGIATPRRLCTACGYGLTAISWNSRTSGRALI